MLSDYSNSPEKPIPWPAGWPDLNSPSTKTISSSGSIGIYLDKSHLQELRALLRQRKEKQAFLINGRKFYIEYRYPFPNIETVWEDIEM
jgi:hypothetical protein